MELGHGPERSKRKVTHTHTRGAVDEDGDFKSDSAIDGCG